MKQFFLMCVLVVGLGCAMSGRASACVGERPFAGRPVLAVATAPFRLVRALRDRACCRRGVFRQVTVERSVVVHRGGTN